MPPSTNPSQKRNSSTARSDAEKQRTKQKLKMHFNYMRLGGKCPGAGPSPPPLESCSLGFNLMVCFGCSFFMGLAQPQCVESGQR
ncbi:hypothetical protein M5D96_001656, partial [Drosophila gunungcola]